MVKNATPITSYFQNEIEGINYLLLKQLEAASEPIGAWTLQEILLEYGVECSPATIGRYLRALDKKEYTRQHSNQGRILTPAGYEYLENLSAQLERAKLHKTISNVMQKRDYDTLVDLLHARITIEKETSALAARKATPRERDELMSVLDRNRMLVKEKKDPTDIALEFHLTIARMSHNKFMLALLNMLIFEERQIEDHFETLVSRERGQEYLPEHEAITRAIIEGDDIQASYHMDKHLSIIMDDLVDEKENKLEIPDA